jgi:hypothetical protein
MTVISTIITRHFSAHASDSFITVLRPTGEREVVEDQAPKLVRVPAWRGIIGYWGLGTHGDDWNTLDWLRREAARAHEHASAAVFSQAVAAGLNPALGARQFLDQRDRGLGIHFTAYEWVDGRWVPELFLISNWTDPSCTSVRPTGFRVTRETYATLKAIPDRADDHGAPACRLAVHQALHDFPLMFRFNNGDPELFNGLADAILDSFLVISSRGSPRDPTSAPTHLSIVRRPVEVVSRLTADFLEPGGRLVGGKPHDLAVTPGGIYESSTGD